MKQGVWTKITKVTVEMVLRCGWLHIAKQMWLLRTLETEDVGQRGLQHEWEL